MKILLIKFYPDISSNTSDFTIPESRKLYFLPQFYICFMILVNIREPIEKFGFLHNRNNRNNWKFGFLNNRHTVNLLVRSTSSKLTYDVLTQLSLSLLFDSPEEVLGSRLTTNNVLAPHLVSCTRHLSFRPRRSVVEKMETVSWIGESEIKLFCPHFFRKERQHLHNDINAPLRTFRQWVIYDRLTTSQMSRFTYSCSRDLPLDTEQRIR